MMDAALEYARHNWPVFPCDPVTKRPLAARGKDGSGGLKLATTDEATIRAWWRRNPFAMIGVPTGQRINAFVLDLDAGVDEKTGEVIDVKDLELVIETEIGSPLPTTWTAETPRGGRHLYFALPPGELPGNRVNILKHIDVRGEGGYVVAPPSVRSDGKVYRWIRRPW